MLEKPFRLGIDLRPLCRPLTGIGRYTFCLLSELSKQKNLVIIGYIDNDILFLPDNFSGTLVHFRKWKFLPRAVRLPFWQHFFLPRQLAKDNLDVFWSPRHHLPLLFSKNIQMALTVHDLVSVKFPETMKYTNLLLEKLQLFRSITRADCVITVSHAIQKEIESYFQVSTQKIKTIHSGVERLELNRAEGLLPARVNKPFILFLGSLEPRKNVDRLLAAFLQLPSALRDRYQLVLAGDIGWKNRQLLEKLSQLEASSEIIYLGYISNELSAALLKQCEFLAFPSIYEGFGLPILEAMQAGAPVLTSAGGACEELGVDAAYYVDPFSVNSISSGLQEMLTNEALRKRLSAKGLERVKDFSWQQSAEAHLKVLKMIAAGHGE